MENMKVLVVDDEGDFIELFVKRLKKRQIDIIGVESGYRALDILKKEKIDVVLLDVKMPGMDGIDTLREIKTKYPLIEVIMITGHGSVESGLQGMIHGAYDYVLKPFDLEVLLNKLKKAFERKRLKEKA
ncbi:MAG: response regulator [Desulfobacterales bacterium]|nr:response regulator [Desulfobacterales bacterium]MBF0398076.1 response regulator [Desulfobacterales bacterium]